jgi:hypothetical protein
MHASVEIAGAAVGVCAHVAGTAAGDAVISRSSYRPDLSPFLRKSAGRNVVCVCKKLASTGEEESGEPVVWMRG